MFVADTGKFRHFVQARLAAFSRRYRARRMRLRELTELHAALFDTVGPMIMVLDRDGCIVHFNRAAQDFVGCSFEQVRDRPFVWTRFLPVEQRDAVLDVFEGLFEGRDFARHDNAWVGRDGEPRMFQWHNSLLREPGGRAHYLVTLGVDVTEARLAVEQARDSQARYRHLVESARDAILLADGAGRFELVNRSCIELLGAERAQELLGRQVVDFVAASSLASVERRWRQLLEQGGSVPPLVIRMRRLDGTEVEVESVASAYLAGGRHNVHVVLRDLGERRRLEREVVEAATAEQERIGREIHDGIGQKLTGLGLLCAGLRQRLLRERHEEAAAAADMLLQELQTATAEVRMLARGLSPIRIDNGSLGAALQGLADSVACSAGLVCELVLHGDVPGLDEGVATQLYRIAQEALNNAVKHAGARRLAVELEVRGAHACLQVRDDGIGLAQARHDGLGMSTMRHRAALIGASLEVESAPGAGTRVRCCCALGAGTASAQWAAEPGAEPGTASEATRP